MRSIHYVRFFFLFLFGSAVYSAIAYGAVDKKANTRFLQVKSYRSAEAITLSEVVSKGRFLILSNGSVWAVHPRDQIITREWITPSVIAIESTEDKSFPYQLKNENTQTSVKVKKSSIEEIYLLMEEQKLNDQKPTDLEDTIKSEPFPQSQRKPAPPQTESPKTLKKPQPKQQPVKPAK